MSTITKEFAQDIIRGHGYGVAPSAVEALARIALASLEAEAVGYMNRFTGRVFTLEEQPGADTDFQVYIPVYTDPPAPSNAEPVAWLWSHRKHQSEVTLVRPENDEKAEGAHWSGWSCQALYAAPPAPVSVPLAIHDEDFEKALSVLNDTLDDCGDSERGLLLALDKAGIEVRSDACRAAMLQGADGNSPVMPDGWVACSERMPENDDFVYIWPRPDFGVELHVAQYGKFDKRDAGWYAQVYEQNYGIEYYPVKVTHWMPLPAAPQQEA